ncbi:glycine cleavage system protein H [Streptomyces sp. NPDC005151]
MTTIQVCGLSGRRTATGRTCRPRGSLATSRPSPAEPQVGYLVAVKLPAAGTLLDGGATFGEYESTTLVTDVYAPTSGTVVAANETLAEEPELLTSDPYHDGWLIEMEVSDPERIDNLLTAEEYQQVLMAGLGQEPSASEISKATSAERRPDAGTGEQRVRVPRGELRSQRERT